MFDKEILEYENQLLHDEVAFEQACFEQSLNLRRIKNKLILENAVMESTEVTDLYLAEAKESGEKKQGILSRLITTIKNFIKKIINKITGGKFEAKQDKKLPENPNELMKYGRELMNKARVALTSPTAKKVAKTAGIATATAGAVAGGGFLLVKSKQGPTLAEIRKFMDETNNRLAACQEIVDGKTVGNVELAQEYIKEFGNITSRLSKITNAIMGKGDLETRSQEDIKASQDGKARLNGMTTEDLKKKHDELTAEIAELKSHKSFSTKYNQAKASAKDKSGYTGSYIKGRREADAARLAKLEDQLSQVKDLLTISARRDSHKDAEDLYKK